MNPSALFIFCTWLVRAGQEDCVLVYMLAADGRMNILRMIGESEIDAWENSAALEQLDDES